MDAIEEDKEINSLEGPDTNRSTDSTSQPTDALGSMKSSGNAPVPDRPVKKEKINTRLQNLITRVNIYLLLFILVVMVAMAVVFVSVQRNNQELGEAELSTQQLTAEELQKLSGGDAKVGDAKQTLTIESNAIFAGQALVRGNLDVAGAIKVGSALDVPGLNVGGNSVLGQVSANDLTVANNASIQGQLNVQRALTVAGGATFGGPISAPQVTVNSLQLNGDLVITRHISTSGPTPGKTNGTALGGGGTSSISGTDTAGTLSVNVGSGAPAGCFATITFAQAFNGTPRVVVTPIGSAGGTLNYYINRSAANFSICTSTAPPAGASFAFDYIVIN